MMYRVHKARSRVLRQSCHRKATGDPTTEDGPQPFPDEGKLAANLDLTMPLLRSRLPKVGCSPVYSYVLTSVETCNGKFEQTGSAPNFQGDTVTLCTCKHRMRTALPSRRSRTTSEESNDCLDAWKGVWIAGFGGVGSTQSGANSLFYLMQVSQAYASHFDLWTALSSKVRDAKAASCHRLGDIYRPIGGRIQPGDDSRFDPSLYEPPLPSHPHWPDGWPQDIYYRGFGDRMRLTTRDGPL